MEHLLAGLNRAQHEAVTATEGYVRVIAGAGSGKTRALSHRFAYLVNELGILPGNILCVTFTNKSANEMRQRIHALTGDNDTGYINTFHGFCVSVLQEDSHAVQYPKSFLVLDNSDIDAMLGIIYEERGLTLRDMTYSAARDMIEIRKLFKEPEYYKDMITMSLDTLREKYERADTAGDIIFYGYLYQEKKCFGLDYNDLIKFSLYIFEQHEDIRLKWQQRLEYIMIDEFQDIDALQYELMEVLCGYHGNLFIVGDPDQTIYTWRGANVKYLLDFDKVFPNVQTIMMMENYRSTPEILAAANSLIAKNGHRIKKDLIPTKPSGEKVVCHFADTQEAEAQWMDGVPCAVHHRMVGHNEVEAACDSLPHHPLRDVQRYQDAVYSPVWVAHQMSHVVPTGRQLAGCPFVKRLFHLPYRCHIASLFSSSSAASASACAASAGPLGSLLRRRPSAERRSLAACSARYAPYSGSPSNRMPHRASASVRERCAPPVTVRMG